MKRAPPPVAPDFAALNKQDLLALADRLRDDVPEAVEQCVAFVAADTLRNGHGRARAMMARRLKHCRVDADQRERLVDAILLRLVSGRFSEQFKDQLRLALHLDAARVFAVARSGQHAPAEHVRRYIQWILRHDIRRQATSERE